ncbi:zinc ribbon domain-containing protein [Mesorhizobium onobrychidis]|uniref:zinc ribbon domain-containing protein n=1 Tax=Mesorhizobium onobrychidis TaxID=2775404 RepID=UPI0035A8A70A
MGFLLFWLGLSAIVGVAAGKRNRSTFGWFLLAILISPLLAGLLVLALGDRRPPPSQYTVQMPVTGPGITFGPILEKQCPDCAEMVKADARICRFCRHQF